MSIGELDRTIDKIRAEQEAAAAVGSSGEVDRAATLAGRVPGWTTLSELQQGGILHQLVKYGTGSWTDVEVAEVVRFILGRYYINRSMQEKASNGLGASARGFLVEFAHTRRAASKSGRRAQTRESAGSRGGSASAPPASMAATTTAEGKVTSRATPLRTIPEETTQGSCGAHAPPASMAKRSKVDSCAARAKTTRAAPEASLPPPASTLRSRQGDVAWDTLLSAPQDVEAARRDEVAAQQLRAHGRPRCPTTAERSHAGRFAQVQIALKHSTAPRERGVLRECAGQRSQEVEREEGSVGGVQDENTPPGQPSEKALGKRRALDFEPNL
ncbi:hypothetical protein B0H11DRAFT_2031147 [Mycena galericulata]|nr:hypothetical protein B0H11DRAFT_2031147 [Mycena galericulata]